MAKSGLFYTGVGDRVICFYCGIRLIKWQQGDNAFTDEHEKYSPDCGFLKCADIT